MKYAQAVTLSQVHKTAKQLAANLHGGEILALTGPLGSGKTTFTQTLAASLGVTETVTSPTFVIMNRYEGHVNKQKLYIYHLDLYRTKNFKEVAALGIQEIWSRPDTITVIEWADKITGHLPPNTQYFNFIA